MNGRAAEKPGVTQPSCVTAWVTRCILPINHLPFIERLLQPQLSCTPCHSELQEAWWHHSALQLRKLGLRKWEQLCFGQFIKESIELAWSSSCIHPLSEPGCPSTWQGCWVYLGQCLAGYCVQVWESNTLFPQSFSRVSNPCSHRAVRDL